MSDTPKVWVVGATVFQPDRDGRYHLVEYALRTTNVRAFFSSGAAETHAAEEERAELRTLLAEDLLSDYCSPRQVERQTSATRTRLALLLHDEEISDVDAWEVCRGPFRTLSDAECDEVLAIFPHLKWVVREVEVETGFTQ